MMPSYEVQVMPTFVVSAHIYKGYGDIFLKAMKKII